MYFLQISVLKGSPMVNSSVTNSEVFAVYKIMYKDKMDNAKLSLIADCSVNAFGILKPNILSAIAQSKPKEKNI